MEIIKKTHFSRVSNKIFFDAREIQRNIWQSKDELGNPIIKIPIGESEETAVAHLGDYLVEISEGQLLPCRPELFNFLSNTYIIKSKKDIEKAAEIAKFSHSDLGFYDEGKRVEQDILSLNEN